MIIMRLCFVTYVIIKRKSKDVNMEKVNRDNSQPITDDRTLQNTVNISKMAQGVGLALLGLGAVGALVAGGIMIHSSMMDNSVDITQNVVDLGDAAVYGLVAAGGTALVGLVAVDVASGKKKKAQKKLDVQPIGLSYPDDPKRKENVSFVEQIKGWFKKPETQYVATG